MRGGYRAWQLRTLLWNRLCPGAVVLMYHRVEEQPADGLGLAVSAAHFAEQLDVVRSLGIPTPLTRVAARLAAGQTLKGMIGVTFDDGYADNLLVAKPLLERAGVPATVFVTSGSLGSGREFWWDELEAIAAATGASVFDLRARLRLLPPTELQAALERQREASGADRSPRPAPRPLTMDETALLAAGGLVDVGSHTVSHVALACLSPAAQYRELAESRRTLEDVIGRRVDSLSYPFGGTADLGPTTAAIAESCGYRSACANWPGTVTRGTDRMRLPRFPVRDWGGDEFAARLSAWLKGLRLFAAE